MTCGQEKRGLRNAYPMRFATHDGVIGPDIQACLRHATRPRFGAKAAIFPFRDALGRGPAFLSTLPAGGLKMEEFSSPLAPSPWGIGLYKRGSMC
jgi:hypothetical protein